jgi:hypothetical protein
MESLEGSTNASLLYQLRDGQAGTLLATSRDRKVAEVLAGPSAEGDKLRMDPGDTTGPYFYKLKVILCTRSRRSDTIFKSNPHYPGDPAWRAWVSCRFRA